MTGAPGSNSPRPSGVVPEQRALPFTGHRIDQCDLCGSASARSVLNSPSLDGPLVRCNACGLHYVSVRSSGLTFGEDTAEVTAEQLRGANARFEDLPRSEERRLNELNAGWRLDLIRRHRGSGRLLEVGCGRGDFLRVARRHFEVFGVEPNPELAADSGNEAPLHRGLVEDAPWTDFDVVASFHVIEHVDSPARFINEMGRRLKPGGLLVLETPDIGSWSYRLFGARWRQFIPEHYFFFDRTTLTRLISERGFEVSLLTRVGKYASLALILNRLARQFSPLGRVSGLKSSHAFRVNPRDILLVLATRT